VVLEAYTLNPRAELRVYVEILSAPIVLKRSRNTNQFHFIPVSEIILPWYYSDCYDGAIAEVVNIDFYHD